MNNLLFESTPKILKIDRNVITPTAFLKTLYILQSQSFQKKYCPSSNSQNSSYKTLIIKGMQKYQNMKRNTKFAIS